MKGFTLIEMIVVVALGLVIMTTTAVLLVGGQRRAINTSSLEQILSDIRSVQVKAMTGISGGGDYGIHFEENSYTLFKGSVYNAADPENFVVNFDHSVSLSSTFSGAAIVFLGISGDINNFVVGQDTLSIIDSTDNTTKVIRFNKYGVPISES